MLSSSSPVLDSKLIQEMWAGRVPIHFSLASQEITSMDVPLPSVLLLPRMSYLPLCTDSVRHHFLPSAPAVEDEMWFEEAGSPLKWTLPIGVLIDISTAKQQCKHDALSSLPSPSSPFPYLSPSQAHLLPLRDVDLPFRVTVHFQQFPARRLLRCRSLHTVRQHFLNSLKEATFIKQGHVKSVMQASPKDHGRLWDALVAQHADAFAPLIAALSPSPSPLSSVPLRLFLVGFLPDELSLLASEHSAGGYELSELHYLPVQRPVSVKGGETLEDVLRELLGAGVGGGGTLDGVQVVVQGVVMALTTPVEWVYRHCAHPDQFLYLVALRRH